LKFARVEIGRDDMLHMACKEIENVIEMALKKRD
jgi:hypothetical protein